MDPANRLQGIDILLLNCIQIIEFEIGVTRRRWRQRSILWGATIKPGETRVMDDLTDTLAAMAAESAADTLDLGYYGLLLR